MSREFYYKRMSRDFSYEITEDEWRARQCEDAYEPGPYDGPDPSAEFGFEESFTNKGEP